MVCISNLHHLEALQTRMPQPAQQMFYHGHCAHSFPPFTNDSSLKAMRARGRIGRARSAKILHSTVKTQSQTTRMILKFYKAPCHPGNIHKLHQCDPVISPDSGARTPCKVRKTSQAGG